MKIAVFHNFMDNIGGAEIVALTLARELEADIYTTNIDFLKIEKMGFGEVVPRIHSIGRLPKKAPFRQQLALFKFRHLNLSGHYDFFIIAGDWAMSGAVNNHPNIWYVHSPLNELWAFTDFISKHVISFWKRPIYKIWLNYNRWLTRKYAKQVDNWVCNSENTKTRIKKYYYQEASVIYPPIDINPTSKSKKDGAKTYWLSVNRLITHKRIEKQLEAFALMPDKKLIIVGSYEKGVYQFEKYKKFLESIKPKNVEIKHWLSSDELSQLYANCDGLITTAENEDFGMTAVEAMAQGKPVIAPHEGGYQESILDGKTGILLSSLEPQIIIDAITEIENNLAKDSGFYQSTCRLRAENFSTNVFIEKIKKIINESREIKTLQKIKNEK